MNYRFNNAILFFMTYPYHTTTQDFLHGRFFVVLCFSMFLAATGCASSPRMGVSRIREVTMEIPGLPASLAGYRIAFVSDIHYGNRFPAERMERLVAAVNASAADVILIGGDNTLGTAQIAPFSRLAGGFTARHGVYAALGNHDFYNSRSQSIQTLRREGIVVLDESVVETPAGLTVAGINDLRDLYPVMGRFRDILDPEETTVLICHNPDFAEEGDLSSFDLVLSGHTHGGQITFFGYAPVIPSAYGQKYRTGTVYAQGKPVIISNGAGYSGNGILRFRLFAPSDFLLVTLQPRPPGSDR